MLATEISGGNEASSDISRLIQALDALMFAIHSIGPDVPDIEESDLDPPESDYHQVYETVAHRYPSLGYYWNALQRKIQDGAEGGLAVGDAIDDLADILIALREVQWFNEHVGRKDALAALRARYDMHLWMHIHSLRHYLEELKRDG